VADIRPFRGYFYNPGLVDIGAVVAPPYDVISAHQQELLYTRHPANIIRLILGKESDRYSSAAGYFSVWKKSEILLRDEKPGFYLLSQAFVLPDGRRVERKGFIAACRLEDLGKGSIVPHERTLSKPKEDRFRLFLATGAMFSQVFSLYRDEQGTLDPVMQKAMGDAPGLDVEFDHVRNRIWRLLDASATGTIARFISTQKVFVADGHHRYETALLYRDAMRLRNPNWTGDEAFNFIPMFFTNMADPGLVILPTHRIIHGLDGFDQQNLLARLNDHFRLTHFENSGEMLTALRRDASGSIGVVLPKSPKFSLAEIRNRGQLPEDTTPSLLWELDVTLLHNLILAGILGMSEEDVAKKKHLDYIRDETEAIGAVLANRAQAAFLLNATPVDEVRRIAEAGYTMPQKSTYFFPKLLSGTVMYSFDDW